VKVSIAESQVGDAFKGLRRGIVNLSEREKGKWEGALCATE